MTVATEGDLGDICYLLCVMSGMTGGPHDLVIRTSDHTKIRSVVDAERMCRMWKSLAESQPYIRSVSVYDGRSVDWNSGDFRRCNVHRPTMTLLSAHVRHYNLSMRGSIAIDGSEAWITVDPVKGIDGRVIVNRTDRYQNWLFPWKLVVEHYGHRILFLGSENEHRSFCNSFGNVEFRETEDLRDVAALIAGSSLFIGNQSVCGAICEAMKHRHIQETSLGVPDCIFKRGNVQHVTDGSCVLPDVAGSGELSIGTQISYTQSPEMVNIGCPPPCHWVYGDRRNISCRALAGQLSAMDRSKTWQEWTNEIVRQTINRHPEFFRDMGAEGIIGACREALKNAGY